MAMLQGIAGANAIPEQTGNVSIPKLPAGGYVCRILNVGVDSTQNGSTFIKLQIDIQEGEYAAHFTKLWNASKNSQYERKWKGVCKIFLPTNHGDAEKYKKAIAFYKGQVNSITRSNGMPEMNIEAGYDPDVFKGKLVGVLFREAEYDIDGKKGTFTEPAFLTDAAKSAAVTFRYRRCGGYSHKPPIHLQPPHHSQQAASGGCTSVSAAESISYTSNATNGSTACTASQFCSTAATADISE